MALRTLKEEFAKMGLLTEEDIESALEHDNDDEDIEEEYEDDDEDDELEEAKRFQAGTARLVRQKTQSQITKETGMTKSQRKREGKKYRRSSAGKKAARMRKKKMRLLRKRGSYKRLMAKRAKKQAASFEQPGSTLDGGTDRLDVLMSELHGLTETVADESQDSGEDQGELTLEERLVAAYGNIAVIADAIGTRLSEDDDLASDLDELAEHAVEVAEGIVEGTIDPEVAAAEIQGYVKDLIEGVGEVADELDEEFGDEDTDEESED